MGRIITSNGNSRADAMARDINRVVKQHLSINRPFMLLVVGVEGDVMTLSNMNIHEERCKMLDEALTRARSSS